MPIKAQVAAVTALAVLMFAVPPPAAAHAWPTKPALEASVMLHEANARVRPLKRRLVRPLPPSPCRKTVCPR